MLVKGVPESTQIAQLMNLMLSMTVLLEMLYTLVTGSEIDREAFSLLVSFHSAEWFYVGW